MEKALIVENVGKMYRLGTVGTGTLSHDLNRFWHKVRGKEDPYTKVGQENNRATASENPYVWALKDINFSVDKGEVLGIIGKNGAGKSTLLKILSKITSPTTGCIKVNGRIASLLEVGTGFHPELTGRENIYLNGAILGMKRHEIKAKFDEIVEFSGCERYLDTPVKRYSSGMYVRLAFAVAAHLESEILIVDEVLAVGDAEFQKKCLGKMKDVSRNDGRTVLFVSHNMSSISELCKRSILLEKGTIVFDADTPSTLKRYLYSDTHSNNSILESTNRTGNLDVKFASLNFTNSNNELVDYVSNELVNINLSLESQVEGEFEIGLSLHNSIGNIISINYNTYTNVAIKLKKGRNEFTIKNVNLPLMPGEYFFRGLIQKNSHIIDWPDFNLFNFIISNEKLPGFKSEVDKGKELYINLNWNEAILKENY